VFREIDGQEDEDVDLDEFADEIEGWVIDELKRIGLDTAKSVLALSAEELVRRTDLEEETVEHVLSVLRKEFEYGRSPGAFKMGARRELIGKKEQYLKYGRREIDQVKSGSQKAQCWA